LRRAGRFVSSRGIAGAAGEGYQLDAFSAGRRAGYGLQPTHVGYEAVGMPDIIAHANANTMVALQIETKTALERIDELLSVPKIDAVMIGPADLSISLGVAGQFEHPTLVAAIEKIRDACIRHGIAPGIHMRSLKLVQYWRDHGMLFLSCNSEIGFMLEKATETVAALKG
jgi:2-keto-3-deoxy-L-rhamnonate aldolase RhmA